MMSKSGYSDRKLLEYIDKHYDEIECELNGEMYNDPKKRDRYFCMDCKLRKIVDYEKSTLKSRLWFALNVEYLSTISSSVVERGLLQMTLWKRLGIKYTMKLTYCTTTPYQ